MYGKLVNNNLIYAPRNLVLENGSKIFNFNNSIELMKSNGYKEIIDNMPELEEENKHYEISGYLENEDTIEVQYELVENIIYESDKEKINRLEAEKEILNNKVDELYKNLDITLMAIDELYNIFEGGVE